MGEDESRARIVMSGFLLCEFETANVEIKDTTMRPQLMMDSHLPVVHEYKSICIHGLAVLAGFYQQRMD